MKILLILTMLIMSVNVAAVTSIKKGEISKQDGFVFTKGEEKKIRKIRQDNITLKDLNTLKDEKIKIQQERIVIIKEQNADLKFVSKYGKYVYYFAGMVMSSLSIYLGAKVSQKYREN